MSDQQAKMDEFYARTEGYGYDSSSSSAGSCYSGSIYSYNSMSSNDVSLISTESTYGSMGSWYGGDTHASGYEADTESLASTKQ